MNDLIDQNDGFGQLSGKDEMMLDIFNLLLINHFFFYHIFIFNYKLR